MPNGKFHLYCKAIKKGTKGTRMGVAIAEKLEGPYTIQDAPVTANKVSIEYGYAFLDSRNVVNFITTDNHGILEKGGGLLWKSGDGLQILVENGQPRYLYAPSGISLDGDRATESHVLEFETP